MDAQRTTATAPRTGVDWGRAEFLLVLLGFLGFVTLPIEISTLYSGLPAHPLLLHVPVMLVPLTAVAAIVLVARPEWLERYGIALAIVSVVTMSSIFLTMHAGSALQDSLALNGEAAELVDEHSEAADTLAVVYVAFTAIVILAFAARRISAGRPTGLAIVDRLLSPPAIFTALRIALVLLAIGAAVMVFRTGDLGAKAVWQGKTSGGSDSALVTP